MPIAENAMRAGNRRRYGTDSSYIAVPGPAPFREPAIGGTYGGYIGMAGNWANWQKCSGDGVVWSATDSRDAEADYADARGIGVGVHWFMGGPGVDPHYNGMTARRALRRPGSQDAARDGAA
jgi:hypothetical protein